MRKNIWIVGYLTRNVADRIYSLVISQWFGSVGKNIRLKSFGVKILMPWNLHIGDSFSSLGKLYLYAGNRLTIGHNVSMNTNVVIDSSGAEISVGDNVLIGQNVVVRAADHVFRSQEMPIRFQGHVGEAIVIEDDVWIAANSVITKGVTIGSGAIVAAGSVVTRDIPPMTIVAGAPARAIGTRGEED